MSGSTTRADIERRAKRLGLFMATSTEADGGTRYKFSATDRNYYAMPRGSALGIREADAWITGYEAAMESVARGQSQKGDAE